MSHIEDGQAAEAGMIRELRKNGYTVLTPEQLEAIEDEQQSWTCGCGTLGIEEALRRTDDPRDRVPGPPLDRDVFIRAALSWIDPPTAAKAVADLPPLWRS